ncbi:hypothetical protein HanHA89_Chr04g0159271 [Helianthus annuus]|nr:hypothetical protein HanHA89_Chr04g0159271 [Helianthus annuus]
MQQVECEEKAAEKAKDEADFLLKMDALNQELLKAEETKNMLLRKVHGEKDGLAITMESLYRRVGHKLDVGDKSLDDLNEMRNALQTCLTTAISNKEYANKKKQEKEAALVCKEIQIKKVVDEINRIKQEALENSKVVMEHSFVAYFIIKILIDNNRLSLFFFLLVTDAGAS